jgi:outer membrane murein-binding lipoprotein Lpp
MVRRDDLEAKIDALKRQKNTMAPEIYKAQLTALLVQLAETQQEIDK